MTKKEKTKEKRKFPFAAVIKYATALLVLLVVPVRLLKKREAAERSVK